MSKFRLWDKEYDTLQDFAKSLLSGEDYDRGGVVESALAEVSNIRQSYARLLQVLYENKTITDDQGFYIVTGYKKEEV